MGWEHFLDFIYIYIYIYLDLYRLKLFDSADLSWCQVQYFILYLLMLVMFQSQRDLNSGLLKAQIKHWNLKVWKSSRLGKAKRDAVLIGLNILSFLDLLDKPIWV